MAKSTVRFPDSRRSRVTRYISQWIATILLVGIAFAGNAQDRITVVGTVVDTAEVPLANVSVTVLDSSKNGTLTDVHGRFVLDVLPGTVLSFSSLSYNDTTYAVPAQAPSSLVIMMTTREVLASDEVVVTAYGKRIRREAVTG